MSTKSDKPKTEKSVKKTAKKSGNGGVKPVDGGSRDAVVVPDRAS